jgi:hypothetical protein
VSEREEMARILVERFSPEELDPAYQAEVARQGFPAPEPVKSSTMVSFVDTDGYRSMSPLTFGEVADALLDAGYVRRADA